MFKLLRLNHWLLLYILLLNNIFINPFLRAKMMKWCNREYYFFKSGMKNKKLTLNH
jgi:hypothetical protein